MSWFGALGELGGWPGLLLVGATYEVCGSGQVVRWFGRLSISLPCESSVDTGHGYYHHRRRCRHHLHHHHHDHVIDSTFIIIMTSMSIMIIRLVVVVNVVGVAIWFQARGDRGKVESKSPYEGLDSASGVALTLALLCRRRRRR